MNRETNKDFYQWHNWKVLIPKIQERTGKVYQPAYVRDVINGVRKNKTLKPHLIEMKLME